MTNNKPRVLVVDDDPTSIDLLAVLLGDNYKLIVAKSGEQALKRARAETPPDIILLDILMPVMDGIEVCRQLKADSATADIPVIFVTALNKVEDETKGFEIGGVDFITKPFSPPVVKARIRTHLKLKDNLCEQKELNNELQTALNEIKTLKGLLPICASCKKIRSQEGDPRDQKSWTSIETYISDHSDTKFTHSVCPACAGRLYPGVKLPERAGK